MAATTKVSSSLCRNIRTSRLFRWILSSDRGSEFSVPVSIECNKETGVIRSKVFYCDTGSPYQKGSIEVNHSIQPVATDITKVFGYNIVVFQQILAVVSQINTTLLP